MHIASDSLYPNSSAHFDAENFLRTVPIVIRKYSVVHFFH